MKTVKKFKDIVEAAQAAMELCNGADFEISKGRDGKYELKYEEKEDGNTGKDRV